MEKLDEIKITEAIIEGYMKNLHEATETDVAIVGAGPAGSEEVIKKKPMWAEGEKEILENTKEVYPGLIVAGTAANIVFGSQKIGSTFGTLLLSGKKAAELILEEVLR